MASDFFCESDYQLLSSAGKPQLSIISSERQSNSFLNFQPSLDDDSEILLDEYLSPTRLGQITGCECLYDVTELTLCVDTTETSLGNFGQFLENLRALRMDDCVIPSLRDLGSSLGNLRTLWMQRSCLEVLDGISSMINLLELFVSYNVITDLSPLGMCENLQVLDLEGNNIEDIDQVLFLSPCAKLARLNLDGNPVCMLPHARSTDTLYNYRQSVQQYLPHLQYLDDEPLNEALTAKPCQNTLRSDWQYLDKLKGDMFIDTTLKEIIEGNEELHIDDRSQCASRSSGRCSRPTSSLRPITSRQLVSSSSLLNQSRLCDTELQENPSDDASDLTVGSIVCGHPAKALLQRKKNSGNSPVGNLSTPLLNARESTTEILDQFISIESKQEVDENEELLSDDKLLDELRDWRSKHEKLLQRIKEEQAPQILKVVPGELASDSESDSLDFTNDSSTDLSPVTPVLQQFQPLVPSTAYVPSKVHDFRKEKFRSKLTPMSCSPASNSPQSPDSIDYSKMDLQNIKLTEDIRDNDYSPDSGFCSAVSLPRTGSGKRSISRSTTDRNLNAEPLPHNILDHYIMKKKTNESNPLEMGNQSKLTNAHGSIKKECSKMNKMDKANKQQKHKITIPLKNCHNT